MEETLEILQDNLGQALIDTAYMVVVSAIIAWYWARWWHCCYI